MVVDSVQTPIITPSSRNRPFTIIDCRLWDDVIDIPSLLSLLRYVLIPEATTNAKSHHDIGIN